MTTRVLLIEDHPIVRAGCRRLLQTRPGLELAEAASAAEGLRLHADLLPDLVILDLNLPDANGLDVLRQLRAARPDARVLVFSMYEDPAFAAHAIEGGALGYVTKSDDPDTLLEAVDKALRGEVHLAHGVAQKLALLHLRRPDDKLHSLSRREREVLDLLGEGHSLAEIAARLAISYRTAANVSSQLKGKLGAATTSALVRIAVEQRQAKAL